MRNYKDLLVWAKAHDLVLAVHKVTRSFPVEERFGLTSQMRRAAGSIPMNLAEGCGRRSDAELARFVQIAMGSGAELSYQLLLARDLGFLPEQSFKQMDSGLDEIMRMLSSLSSKVKPKQERR